MRADDIPAKFFNGVGSIPPLSRDDLSKAVEKGNTSMKYNPEGIPTRAALEEIDLGYVAQELEKRGVLPEPGSIPVT